MAAALVLVLSASLVIGCGSSREISITNQPFTAMPARVEQAGDQWEAIFTAPTGGWQARFDTTRRMFDGWEVFVTLVQPHSSLMVTQALTELHVLTPISIEETMRVYARVVADENPNEKTPGFFSTLFGWLLPKSPDGPAYQPALTQSSDADGAAP